MYIMKWQRANGTRDFQVLASGTGLVNPHSDCNMQYVSWDLVLINTSNMQTCSVTNHLVCNNCVTHRKSTSKTNLDLYSVWKLKDRSEKTISINLSDLIYFEHEFWPITNTYFTKKFWIHFHQNLSPFIFNLNTWKIMHWNMKQIKNLNTGSFGREKTICERNTNRDLEQHWN